MMLAANIAMAVLWAVLIGPFSPSNLLVGFAIGFVTLRLLSVAVGSSRYAYQSLAVVELILFTLWELMLANARVAWHTVASLRTLRPAILAVPLEPGSSDLEIMLLANLITLTPGTLTLDVAKDRSTLFVHCMHVDDPEKEIRAMKHGFERRVLAATRGKGAPA